MPYRFNPFTTQLDFYLTPATGSGVTGPVTSTIQGIATWSDTNGTTLADSPYTIVQAGGAIQAQEFVFNRQIVNDVTVPNKYTMISSDMELVSGDLYLLGDAQVILL